MNDSDEKKNLINTCAFIIYDISYLIWLREVSHSVIEDRNDAIVSFASDDESGLKIYKIFRAQLKNLQKYAPLISKFREIETFIEDIEDNLLCESFLLDTDLFQQIIREVTILKKCKYYSKRMGSIMHRVMPQNSHVMATIIDDISVDQINLQKGELIEIISMESRMKWKIKIKNKGVALISPLLLKINSEKAEEKIIERLIVRMKSLCTEVFDKYLNNICKETNETKWNIKFDESLSEAISLAREYISENNNEIAKKVIYNNLEAIQKIYIILQNWNFEKNTLMVSKAKAIKTNVCSKLKLNFRIEVSDKNVSNKDYLEEICYRSHYLQSEGRSLFSPF